MSVEMAINPLGKKRQFVFVGRKNATVYFSFQLSLFRNPRELSVVSVVLQAGLHSIPYLPRGKVKPLSPGRRAQPLSQRGEIIESGDGVGISCQATTD